MNRSIFRSESDRTASIIILVCFTIVAVGCVLGMSYLFEYNFYQAGNNGETAKSIAVQIYSLDDTEVAKDFYDCIVEKTDEYRIKYYREKFSPANSSYAFTVNDENGRVLLDSTQGSGISFDSVLASSSHTGRSVFNAYDEHGNIVLREINYAIIAEEQLIAKDKYSNAFRWIDIADSLKYFVFVVLFVSILIIVILLSVSTINAGVTDEETGEIIPGFVEKIPLDLCTLFLFGLFCVAWMIVGLTSAADVEMVLNNVVVVITCVAAVLILLTYLNTISVRVKMGRIYKNTVFYMIYRKFKRKTPRKVRKIFSDMSAFKKLIIGIVVFFLLEAAILSSIAYLGILRENVPSKDILILFIIIWGITRLIIIPLFAMIAINLYYVKEEGQRLAEGIIGDSVTEKLTISSIRAHGRNLDQIRKEINKAMAQELKSERLKSELITNVSHDLKTPITSIKNYVDFLQHRDLTEEERVKYTEVIARHTDKLSMLLNDLIEASQISSGSIDINLEKTSLNIMLEQTVEEFSMKLEQSELLPRVSIPENDVYIMGDGQWLWRIFSNLLNNACKYSVPGTDIEISLEKNNGKAIIEIANISKIDLKVEGDELFERFVRGDSSRHTDGNGLGLSIARSLAELQGGTMEISVDGEKFAAIISFNSLSR